MRIENLRPNKRFETDSLRPALRAASARRSSASLGGQSGARLPKASAATREPNEFEQGAAGTDSMGAADALRAVELIHTIIWAVSRLASSRFRFFALLGH
jgi:hypothetical protein